MFRMSKKVDYGVLSIAHLCQNEGKGASAKEIAQHFGISVSFVANILKQLTRKDILNSVRGVMGGYELNRPPDQISVGDVVLALEGEFYLADCNRPDGEKTCTVSDCPVRNPIHEIHRRFVNILNETTFAELLSLPESDGTQRDESAQASEDEETRAFG